MKIKKGDTVYVRRGKDRGKQGTVLRVFSREGRVLVEGIGLQIRHRRPRRSGEKGQRVTIPGPIAIANVQVLCPSCGKPTRIAFRQTGEEKQRVCKKCDTSFR